MKIKTAVCWFRKMIPKWLGDILAGCGAGCTVLGAFFIYYPAGWITTGAALISAAIIWSKGRNVD